MIRPKSLWEQATRGVPMFRGRANLSVTAVLGIFIVYLAYRFTSWGVVNAVWTLPAGTTPSICRANQNHGACWAVITERFRFILFGTFPANQQWRPALACVLFIALFVISARRSFWKAWLPSVWVGIPAFTIVLLKGGFLNLPSVPSELWGGLPLSFLLSTLGFAAAFPLGILLALGRHSKMPVIRILSVAYIELIRGVPLITFLFMAAVMFPLFMPQSFPIDKLIRAQIALVMVIAAYLAEVIRGGLQAVSKGQYEAAASMGLRFWPATFLIVLPQALRASIPALVNTFIGFFKDTSLVAIIGLFDLLGAAKAVIVDPKWMAFGVEVYLFAAAVYFTVCYMVSQYSLRVEKVLLAPGRH